MKSSTHWSKSVNILLVLRFSLFIERLRCSTQTSFSRSYTNWTVKANCFIYLFFMWVCTYRLFLHSLFLINLTIILYYLIYIIMDLSQKLIFNLVSLYLFNNLLLNTNTVCTASHYTTTKNIPVWTGDLLFTVQYLSNKICARACSIQVKGIYINLRLAVQQQNKWKPK